MQINQHEIPCRQIKFSAQEEGKEIGRAFLVLGRNDLHNQPFGLLEDVYVSEEVRGQGVGGELLQKVIATAKQEGCYKLIGTSRYSRPEVHEWYKRLGFEDHGREFRLQFNDNG